MGHLSLQLRIDTRKKRLCERWWCPSVEPRDRWGSFSRDDLRLASLVVVGLPFARKAHLMRRTFGSRQGVSK
jgi:hypothetical protein